MADKKTIGISDFAKEVASVAGVTQKAASSVIKAAETVICEHLAKCDEVQTRIGKFYTFERAGGTMHSAITGKDYTYPSMTTATLKPSTWLKDTLNGKKERLRKT